MNLVRDWQRATTSLGFRSRAPRTAMVAVKQLAVGIIVVGVFAIAQGDDYPHAALKADAVALLQAQLKDHDSLKIQNIVHSQPECKLPDGHLRLLLLYYPPTNSFGGRTNEMAGVNTVTEKAFEQNYAKTKTQFDHKE